MRCLEEIKLDHFPKYYHAVRSIREIAAMIQKPSPVFFFFSSGPTTDIPSRKKRAIVQQTIGITDKLAVHQCVDLYIMHYTVYILQSL